MSKIDDVRWYIEAANPDDDLHHLVTGAHIGIFFKWCAINGLLDQDFVNDFHIELDRLKNGRILIAEFVRQTLDGKLGDDDLNSVGKEFARQYYSEEDDFHKEYSSYLIDFESIDLTLAPENKYTLLSPILSNRFREWQAWIKYEKML